MPVSKSATPQFMELGLLANMILTRELSITFGVQMIRH